MDKCAAYNKSALKKDGEQKFDGHFVLLLTETHTVEEENLKIVLSIIWSNNKYYRLDNVMIGASVEGNQLLKEIVLK